MAAEEEPIVDGVIVEAVEAAGVVAEVLIVEGEVLTAEGEVLAGVEGEVTGDGDKAEEVRDLARLQPSKDKRLHLTECLIILLVHMLYVHLTSSNALYPCYIVLSQRRLF